MGKRERIIDRRSPPSKNPIGSVSLQPLGRKKSAELSEEEEAIFGCGIRFVTTRSKRMYESMYRTDCFARYGVREILSWLESYHGFSVRSWSCVIVMVEYFARRSSSSPRLSRRAVDLTFASRGLVSSIETPSKTGKRGTPSCVISLNLYLTMVLRGGHHSFLI